MPVPAASSQRMPHPAQVRAVRTRLRLSIRDAGLTDLRHPGDDHRGAEGGPFWDIEPSPLIIDAAEWARLEAALSQRARFVNALLVDLYSGQEALKQRIVPPEVVYDDPYYRRPCRGLEAARQHPATLLRFDLVKTARGWMFAATHANTPIGLSYAVQNRRFMTQEATEFYRGLPDYQSVINFPLRLLDALHRLAPRQERAPSIVVLTAGPLDPFYSEHSFLARKMGLPLARGDDLLVLDNAVYFKTIAGLERVDVIYRRLNDAYIDPVVFSTDRESAGIPGLLQCIRAGNVAIANAIGTGLAESRAFDLHLPRLMRFYLGEAPLLPSIPTYTCGDTDQLDYILENRDRLELRSVHEPRRTEERARLRPGDLLDERGLAPIVRRNPHAFVAQEKVEAVPLNPGAPKSPPFRLSAFVLSQARRTDVFPGGLTRVGGDEPPLDRVGVTADTLVLSPTDTGEGGVADLEEASEADITPTTLGSRSAEGLFWLGRYLERAESTARMLLILDDVALEEIPPDDRRRWVPVWRGLLEATGHTKEKITARARPQAALSSDLMWRMTFEGGSPSSILSSVNAARENARQLRDLVSPEAWTVLTRLQGQLDELARRKPGRPRPDERTRAKPASREAIGAVITEVNAFLGIAERTMLHDAGWHFLRMGLHLERAIMTCSALRHVLGSHERSTHDLLTYRDNPELSALLRMLGSQDAYRRLYQTRSQPRWVAHLFLRQSVAPRSILANVRQIRESLDVIRTEVSSDEMGAPTLAVDEVIELLEDLRLEHHFNGRSGGEKAEGRSLEEILAGLLDRLYALHPLLSDHHFSHQARLTPVVDQAEMGW
jgi:uncharacterized circularly permuted ATP-grasp superfamily protein/uncharacterized alpha-E superfamily protein